MKKIISIILVICTIFLLAACSEAPKTAEKCKHDYTEKVTKEASCTEEGTKTLRCSLCDDTYTEDIDAKGHTEEVVAGTEASCLAAGLTEGKKCSDCGEVLQAQEEVAALGHTTTTGTCSRCGLSFGIFSIGYYVDEFNQLTSDGYVCNNSYISGTFSNSATTDSLLYVQVLVDKDDIAFFLYEYGRSLVKNSSSRYVEEYDITMKTADGTKYNLTGTIYCGGDRLFIDSSYEQKVLNALKSGETVSFYIVESERTTTTYLFSVNTSNFAEKYAQLVG